MRRLWLGFLFICHAHLFGSNMPQVTLEPILISRLDRTHTFERAIYSISTRFSTSDTVLFIQKTEYIRITRIDSISQHELRCCFEIAPDFVDFTAHSLIVLGEDSQVKLTVNLTIRYMAAPIIESITLVTHHVEKFDTLQLSYAPSTLATMVLKGQGLFRTSTVEFDEPGIRVLTDPSWRIDQPPAFLQVGLEFNSRDSDVGPKYFRIKNPYAFEGTGMIFVKSIFPPRILSSIASFVADGTEKRLKIQGENFYNGLRAELVPPEAKVSAHVLSKDWIELTFTMPMLEKSGAYRFVLKNPDGQADTSASFTVQTKPIARARIKSIESGVVFTGRSTRLVLAVETLGPWRLYRNRSYEVNIEGERFPVVTVFDDSTCEAQLTVAENKSSAIFRQHVFTINEIDQAPRWRGILTSSPAPLLTYLSENRIIHPMDSLSLILKGHNLDEVHFLIDDPDVSFKVQENRGDLVKVVAIAGEHVSSGRFPLQLRKNGVTFKFPEYAIQVEPWQPFSEFIGMEVSSIGQLEPAQLWRGQNMPHIIKPNDVILVKIYPHKIRAELGAQKLYISGVLMDSSHTIRGEAFDKKNYTVTKRDDPIVWRWRVRERIRSGDRIEIILQNPGRRNRATEAFFVKPHWSESFHGSTSFILFKVPLGGGEATTQIFRSVGLGLSYQPFQDRSFLAFDGSFIVGNEATPEKSTTFVVGFGLSAILWKHIQLGIGTNLTANADYKGFIFMGTRFKLNFPW